MGLWPFTKSKLQLILNLIYSALFEILISYVVAGEITQLLQTEDLLDLAEALVTICTHLLTIMKSFNIIYQRNKLKLIILMINDLYLNTPTESSDKLIHEMVKLKTKIVTFGRLFYSMTLVILCLFVVSCVSKNYSTGEKHYLYQSYYYIDTNNSFLYLMILFIQLVVGWRVIVLLLTDFFFACLVLMICSRIDALLESIEASVEKAQNGDNLELFGQVVEYHKKVLRLVFIFLIISLM